MTKKELQAIAERRYPKMARYQIVYSKRGFPFTMWRSDERQAHDIANRLRTCGYTVNVWVHTETGSCKTDL